jgi:hypothetical protein
MCRLRGSKAKHCSVKLISPSVCGRLVPGAVIVTWWGPGDRLGPCMGGAYGSSLMDLGPRDVVDPATGRALAVSDAAIESVSVSHTRLAIGPG